MEINFVLLCKYQLNVFDLSGVCLCVTCVSILQMLSHRV